MFGFKATVHSGITSSSTGLPGIIVVFCELYLMCLICLGFGLSGDLRRLAESYPTHSSLYNLSSFSPLSHIDYSSLYPHTSLSALVERVLSKKVNKEMQCSDWQQRPLHNKQIEYAAVDAMVLVQVHRYHLLKQTTTTRV